MDAFDFFVVALTIVIVVALGAWFVSEMVDTNEQIQLDKEADFRCKSLGYISGEATRKTSNVGEELIFASCYEGTEVPLLDE